MNLGKAVVQPCRLDLGAGIAMGLVPRQELIDLVLDAFGRAVLVDRSVGLSRIVLFPLPLGIIYKAPEIFRIPLDLSGSFMYNSYVRD